jgi:hypothetical protein
MQPVLPDNLIWIRTAQLDGRIESKTMILKRLAILIGTKSFKQRRDSRWRKENGYAVMFIRPMFMRVMFMRMR